MLTPRDEAIVRHGLQRGYFTHEDVRRALAARPAAPVAALASRLDPRIVAELSAVGVSSTFDGAVTQGDASAGPTRPGSTRTPAASAAAPAAGRLAVVEAYRAERARDPFFAPHADVVLERRGEVGSGGMGVLWRVVDHRLGREVAKKELRGDASPARARRFLREARITAGLDHPSIPPVHEYGTDTAGRPYLLMRLIGGQTLSKELQRFHGRRGRRAVSRSLLEALVKVSEAVAYAHLRGIVHRDLKPDNVMVGEFGEVMVLDWGVARELSRADEQDDTALIEASPGEAPLTQQGAMVGTPGYMAPEQARGQPVEARADVFALGGILTAILTGEPAVTGEGLPALLHALAEGRLELPRDRWPDAPAELHDLAAAALALDVDARPTAAQFARDLKAYLAGERVSVHRYGPLERATRFARRKATLLVGALAGGVVLAVAGALLAWISGAGQRAEALARADQAREARLAAAAALAKLDRGGPGDERLGIALGALVKAQRWREAARDEASLAAVVSAGRALGQVARATQQWDLASEAYALAGDAPARAEIEVARTAEQERRRVEVGALLDRAASGALAAEQDGLEDALFSIVRYPEQATVALLAARLDEVSAGQVRSRGAADVARLLADALGRIAAPGDAVAVEALGRHLAAEQDELRAVPSALALCRLGGERAMELVHDARQRFGISGAFDDQVRRAMAGDAAGAPAGADPETGSDFFRRAERRAAEGDHAGAVEDYGRDIEQDPQNPVAHLNRAFSRRALGDLRGALEDYDRAIALGPRDPLAYLGRGVVRIELDDPGAALADFDRAIALDPSDAVAFMNRGSLRRVQGDPAGAIADLDRAIELDPREATSYINRGLARRGRGELAGALADLDRAIELDPGFSLAYLNRGTVRQDLRQLAGAIEDFGRAIELEPGSSAAHVNRANARALAGDAQGARGDYDRAIELDPENGAAYRNRAIARHDQGDPAGAIPDYGRAIELDPRDAVAHRNRGLARKVLGDLRGALADYQRFLELTPADDAQAIKVRAEVERLRAAGGPP